MNREVYPFRNAGSKQRCNLRGVPFYHLGEEKIVLPTGFEPVLKPREGFMIGRYTTGATYLNIEK